MGTNIPRLSTLAIASMVAAGAQAFEIDTGESDVKVRLDTTVKYSAAARLLGRAAALSSEGPAAPNQNDGNNNFGRGLVSNRVDLLSELDITTERVGARISGAAWYDTVYNQSNDNNSLTANRTPGNRFSSETRRIMGRDAEVLDAFVFGRFDLGERLATVRLGRHSLLWGESLFFGANGIAGGQAPVDVVKAQSVPNSQFKEIIRPTGKLSGNFPLSDTISVGGYLGYEWEASRLQPVGAYLSASDSLGPEGGERILAGPFEFRRQSELEPRDSGQYGVQLRWLADSIDTDFGFYAIRYHAMSPSNIWTTVTGVPPATAPDSYRWVYHEGIRAYGISAAKTVGSWSLGAEVSLRENAPLSSGGQTILSTIGVNTGFDNKNNPGYAVGRTGHAQLSWIASLGPSPLYQEASFTGEVAWNRVLSVTDNRQMLNPVADRDATLIRMVFAPTYRQVLPGLDLSVPVGVSYTAGRSGAVGPAFGVHRGGDFNIGLQGTYLNRYMILLSYVNFYGPTGPSLNAENFTQFKQALKDRDYVSVSLRTTF
ncbi:MAG: DUF1302 domain-containing protein [Rhodocyclaceae bacterium]